MSHLPRSSQNTPCAVRQVPTGYLFCTWELVYVDQSQSPSLCHLRALLSISEGYSLIRGSNGEKSAFTIHPSAHHGPTLPEYLSHPPLYPSSCCCSRVIRTEFGVLQKSRGFMWELIPGSTVRRGWGGGRKALKPESEGRSHWGLSPAEGPLRRCVKHASGCPSEGSSVFIYLPLSCPSLVERCPRGVKSLALWGCLACYGWSSAQDTGKLQGGKAEGSKV